MKFFDRIKLAFNQSSFDDYIQRFLTGDEARPADIDISGNASLTFTAVFQCIRVLAETFASVPVFEYKKLDDGDRAATDETGWYDILHNKFNDEMCAYNAKETAMYQLCLGGNAVFQRLLSKISKEPLGLYPYEWQRVAFERDKISKKLLYIVDNNQAQKKTRADVLHVAGPSLNGTIGMSPIEYASQAVKLGKIYESFGVNFYKNGAITSGTFEHPGHLEDDAYLRLKESIKCEWTGVKNMGTPLLLEDGMKFNPIQMKLVDAELLASKKYQKEEICGLYRVPPHLVQNLDRATNNNIEHQSLEFVMYTMLPHFKRFEENYNVQLLTKEQRAAGYYFEHNISTLLRGDSKSMAEAFATGRQWGWLSVNDIRRLMNMNRVENGDIYLQPMNMIEAGKQAVEEGYKKELENIYKLIETRGK